MEMKLVVLTAATNAATGLKKYPYSRIGEILCGDHSDATKIG
jgi:hypothetical protein